MVFKKESIKSNISQATQCMIMQFSPSTESAHCPVMTTF